MYLFVIFFLKYWAEVTTRELIKKQSVPTVRESKYLYLLKNVSQSVYIIL